jgi:hypothetical protein
MTDPTSTVSSSKEPRLLDRVREAARVRHLSLRTEKTYVQWIRRFILFHGRWRGCQPHNEPSPPCRFDRPRSASHPRARPDRHLA